MENPALYDPREEIIEEFLDGQPRAAKWREYKEALRTRLAIAREKRDALPESSPERAEWEQKVVELREQVRVLAEEEAITEFVEDSVRASVSRPRPFPDFDDEE